MREKKEIITISHEKAIDSAKCVTLITPMLSFLKTKTTEKTRNISYPTKNKPLTKINNYNKHDNITVYNVKP